MVFGFTEIVPRVISSIDSISVAVGRLARDQVEDQQGKTSRRRMSPPNASEDGRGSVSLGLSIRHRRESTGLVTS